MFSPKVLVFGLLASCAIALPLDRRAVIAHDAVVGFAQAVPSGTTGTLMLKYKPWLKVFNGCVPFPAVDAAGNTGGGLSPSGDSNGGCSASTGQPVVWAGTQARLGEHCRLAVFRVDIGYYPWCGDFGAWRISKDEFSAARWYVVSFFRHYVRKRFADLGVGTRPKIGYISYYPVNHQLIATDDKGGEQPLIAWESMTAAARTAIENTDFGDATPSFRDSNFQTYLADAFI
ncbi:hypothetical protein N0V90_005236 [Kalmusia sp. IMI 367209]|nr:hypothetical protein N0V90_005236 [Kalmusia sp. IMI 367209]